MGLIKQTVNLLGLRAKDKVTNCEGVITSVGFDLYGCVQVAITPPAKADGDLPDGRWFDVNRIDFPKDERVMPVPDFDARADEPAKYTHGAADKPAPR